MDGIFDWYALGVELGLGVAAGTALAGFRSHRALSAVGLALVCAAAAALAALAGLVWLVVGLVAGALIAAFSLRRLSAEALPAAFLGAAALAFVPVAGYIVGLGAPFAGRRLGRRARSRYAGLRILARD